jgi:hypothetical protein
MHSWAQYLFNLHLLILILLALQVRNCVIFSGIVDRLQSQVLRSTSMQARNPLQLPRIGSSSLLRYRSDLETCTRYLEAREQSERRAIFACTGQHNTTHYNTINPEQVSTSRVRFSRSVDQTKKTPACRHNRKRRNSNLHVAIILTLSQQPISVSFYRIFA